MVGDVVTSINKKTVGDLSLEQVALLVASSPRRFLVRVVRGVPLMQRNGLPSGGSRGDKVTETAQ